MSLPQPFEGKIDSTVALCLILKAQFEQVTNYKAKVDLN